MTNLHPITTTLTPGIQVEIEYVTPEIAGEWLSKNSRNRNLTKSKVATYARDMAEGHWQITGEAIKFNTDGVLSDGQHRLHAIVKSGATVPLLVVRGIAPEAQSVMDTGKKRSASDALGLQGHVNTNLLAATCRLAINYQAKGFSDTRNLGSESTNTEILEFADKHLELTEAVTKANSGKKSVDLSPSVLALAIWRTGQIAPDDSDIFFAKLMNNHTDGPGDPVHTLIDRLASARRQGIRLNASDQLSLTFRAWNAWREGKKLLKMPTRSREGTIAIPEPK